jgi:hypothetical protein
MASTARSTLAQAVMTTTGKRGIEGLQPAEQIETFAPTGGVARIIEVDQGQIESRATRAP